MKKEQPAGKHARKKCLPVVPSTFFRSLFPAALHNGPNSQSHLVRSRKRSGHVDDRRPQIPTGACVEQAERRRPGGTCPRWFQMQHSDADKRAQNTATPSASALDVAAVAENRLDERLTTKEDRRDKRAAKVHAWKMFRDERAERARDRRAAEHEEREDRRVRAMRFALPKAEPKRPRAASI